MRKAREVTMIEILLGLAVAALFGAGLGAGLENQIGERQAAAATAATRADRERERAVWAGETAHLNAIIESERTRHVDQVRERDAHLSAFTGRTIRLRRDLEAMLADSRRANDACTGRIAAISSDLGQLGELLGQSAELLEAGQAEIVRIERENGRLGRIVAGWQQRYHDEHPEQVIVTGGARR
jgi:hypothetical protein